MEDIFWYLIQIFSWQFYIMCWDFFGIPLKLCCVDIIRFLNDENIYTIPDNRIIPSLELLLANEKFRMIKKFLVIKSAM